MDTVTLIANVCFALHGVQLFIVGWLVRKIWRDADSVKKAHRHIDQLSMELLGHELRADD